VSTAARPAHTAPAVEQLGPALIVRGKALNMLVFALSRGIDDRVRANRPDHVAELKAFREIAWSAAQSVSPQRHGDVAITTTPARSTTCESDWVTTSEAAARAGLSRRQVERIAHLLAQQGAARRVVGRWLLDPIAFAAHRNGREIDHDAA